MGYTVTERPDQPDGPPFTIKPCKINVAASVNTANAFGINAIEEAIGVACSGDVGEYSPQYKRPMEECAKNGNRFIGRYLIKALILNLVFNPDGDGGYTVIAALDEEMMDIIKDGLGIGGKDE